MIASGRIRTALLGATGHVAKSLIHGLSGRGKYDLFLFARSADRVREFLAGLGTIPAAAASVIPYPEFNRLPCDVVINCVGFVAGTDSPGASVFRLTEGFDNMILDYLEAHPRTLYISLSSGAAYCTDFEAPVGDGTRTRLDINRIDPSSHYGIAKLHMEAKHRACADKRIVDLRVFSFFSRFQDLGRRFFMSDVISCIREKRTLVTGREDIVRDYVHPKDLLALVEACMAHGEINEAFDVYSREPARKSEILSHFASRHGLRYVTDDGAAARSATGIKSQYFSTCRKAEKLGYSPTYSSMECLEEEARALLVRG